MSGIELSQDVTDRLGKEAVAWLVTVNAKGQPQASPVWYLWHGGALWVQSQPDVGKTRNIGTNPKVAFHLDGDGRGGGIVSIDATAELGGTPSEGYREAYAAKYEHLITGALKTTVEGFFDDYSVPIAITPARVRAW
ncbi:pyridoxamine 5'-phosphate oxidase family protein [Amycolatopsis sp. CA-230715]|uniref:pyridoxamine 5'-phosphate oxidase family protein n=1 Tax=Amycolatopsis sp. CA-230715 TaxID=2745196 RepID=UPI001C01C2BF|nr:pyridoxamine 5'-phosphate oxidase family protein [Amycolatopsis sp. CA-230715]QWF77250.1 hypothetical protein HUW46_00640 [Amycolatopsis sp. CA-230715]